MTIYTLADSVLCAVCAFTIQPGTTVVLTQMGWTHPVCSPEPLLDPLPVVTCARELEARPHHVTGTKQLTCAACGAVRPR